MLSICSPSVIQRATERIASHVKHRSHTADRFAAALNGLPGMSDLPVNAGGRPTRLPRRFAAFMPALVRSRMRSRSNSARAPMM